MLLPRSVVEKLIWRMKRLSCMSLPEIFHRVIVLGKNELEKLGFLVVHNPPSPNLELSSVCWFGKSRIVDSTQYCQAADKIMRGVIDVFDLGDCRLGDPLEWNRDPLTGKNAPMVFGKALDYRNEELVGDIKYLWEPSRHLHLVTLAQAYSLTGSKVYLNALRQHLTSWFDQCPYLMGPQWVSSLELAIRLINWYLAWQLIGGHNSDLFEGKNGIVFRDQWTKSIYQHVHFINGYYSKYSSANNHLIGEAAGVFIATTGWPYWPEFSAWQRKSAYILEREILLQNTSDGVNREQAIAYQQFVLDFLLLSKLTADANQFEFSEHLIDRMESMLEFVASVMDVAGKLPMIGDGDDGFVVKLCKGDEGWCPFRSLLATGAVIFNRPEFAVKSQKLDDKSRWLLGDEDEIQFDNFFIKDVRLPIKRDFKEGGYYVLGDNFESKYEVKIIADAGPLGYSNIAAHGHADALSFSMFIGGNEILIDPGTYAYHTHKKWRDYFRGTSAHNTVRVDGQNQSVIGGNFMWLRKAKVEQVIWNTNDEEDTLVARHDGYRRLADPVNHKRTISYIKSLRKIIVIDEINCKSSHEIELFWHFGEKCCLEDQQGHINIRNGGVTLRLAMKNPTNVKHYIVSGDDDIPLGWVSRRFGVKEPASTIMFSEKIYGDTKFLTEFQINFDESCMTDLYSVRDNLI